MTYRKRKSEAPDSVASGHWLPEWSEYQPLQYLTKVSVPFGPGESEYHPIRGVEFWIHPWQQSVHDGHSYPGHVVQVPLYIKSRVLQVLDVCRHTVPDILFDESGEEGSLQKPLHLPDQCIPLLHECSQETCVRPLWVDIH